MSDASTAPPVLGDRYQLDRRIARGGMADIYSARDQTLDRTVAVKVLFPHFAADPTFVARFKREARSAGSLSHPNVVAVYDWGSFEDTYYIVMELIDGDSLAEVLRAEGPLSSEQAAYVTREVANALGFAHSHGTVHRDIKPGNIMLTSSGQVKVGDFGIARAYDNTEDDLTQTGHVMGTAAYFSPEQAQGHPIDHRSDLYSLGVVLFEMLTGDKPFTGSSPVSVAYKHVEVQPPRLSSLRGDVDADLERVVEILLAKRPEQRYDDAGELVADLDRIRAGAPIVGVPGAAGAATALAGDGYGPGAHDAPPTVATPTADATHAFGGPESGGYPPAGGYDDYDGGYRPPSGGHPAIDEPPSSRNGALIATLLVVGLLAVVGAIIAFQAIGSGDDEEAETTSTVPTGDVPPVEGMTEEEARITLSDAGFTQITVELVDDEADPGTVVGQDPAPGSSHPLDEPVVLTVSEADELVTMPDLVGETIEAASSTLAGLNLNSTIERQADPDVEAGRVISQDPPANEQVNPGSVVTLIVSSGSNAVEVPDLRGRTESEARGIIIGLGLGVRVEQQTVGAGSPDVGRVIRQSPTPRQDVDPGTEVILTVGEAPDVVATTTPDTTSPPRTTPTVPSTRPTTPTTATTDPPTSPPTSDPDTTPAPGG